MNQVSKYVRVSFEIEFKVGCVSVKWPSSFMTERVCCSPAVVRHASYGQMYRLIWDFKRVADSMINGLVLFCKLRVY